MGFCHSAGHSSRMKRMFSLSGFGLLALSGVLLTGGLVMFITPQTYESVARVTLRTTTTNVVGAHDGDRSTESVESAVAGLRSTATLHTVITNLDLRQKWGARFKLEPLALDMTEKLLRTQLTVKGARESVIEVRAQSEDAAEAAEIANALVEAYQLSRVPGGAKARVVEIADSSLIILEKAVPNLRPVRPHPFVKMLVPFAGLLIGLLGVILLLIGVFQTEKK